MIGDNQLLERQPRLPEGKKSRYYFETADLVIIALFSALGGITSSTIANIIRSAMGFPGGGQLGAGIHIFWFVLIYYLVNKKAGAILLAGILKGFIEFFTGNSLGIMAILLAFGGALIFEVALYIYTMAVRKDRYLNIGVILSSGLASATNILIQLEFFINKDIPLFLCLSFISGVILGGILGIQMYNVFNRAGILNWRQSNLQNI